MVLFKYTLPINSKFYYGIEGGVNNGKRKV